MNVLLETNYTINLTKLDSTVVHFSETFFFAKELPKQENIEIIELGILENQFFW